MFDDTKFSRFRAPLLLCLLLVGGCSKSFVVTSEVPQPLVERMAVSAKLAYTEEFKNYVYIESGDDRALEKVDFGQAQVGLFDRVFENLLTVVEPSASTYDLKIEPQILDFQYSIPAETKLNMYEIWLKYRLRITDQSDNEVADWVVKGYGKTPTSMLASQLKAFNTASNMALRDVGAQLAIGFRTQPSIEDHLAGRSKPKPPSEADQSDTEIDSDTTDDSGVEVPEANVALGDAADNASRELEQDSQAPERLADQAIEAADSVAEEAEEVEEVVETTKKAADEAVAATQIEEAPEASEGDSEE